MGTVGDQVLERINALEARLDQYERTGAAGGIGVPADGIQGLQNELGQLKTRMDELNAPFAQSSNRNPRTQKTGCPIPSPKTSEIAGATGAIIPATGWDNMTPPSQPSLKESNP